MNNIRIVLLSALSILLTSGFLFTKDVLKLPNRCNMIEQLYEAGDYQDFQENCILAYEGDNDARYFMGQFYEDQYNTGNKQRRVKENSLKWYKVAADDGMNEAKLVLAKKLLNVKSASDTITGYISEDMKMGQDYLENLVEVDYVPALVYKGDLLSTGHPLYSKDLENAISLYKTSLNKGSSEAYLGIGKILESGSAGEVDLEKARQYYRKAYEDGIEDAEEALFSIEKRQFCNSLTKVEKDFGFSESLIQTCNDAYEGNSRAQYVMSEAYINGILEDSQENNSFLWTKRAAENGNKDAQYRLGLAFFRGLGVDKDYQEAREWLFRAVENKHAKANRLYALLLIEQYVENINANKVVGYLQEAVKLGDNNSNIILYHIFNDGIIVDRDTKKAESFLLRYNELAAKNNNSEEKVKQAILSAKVKYGYNKQEDVISDELYKPTY